MLADPPLKCQQDDRSGWLVHHLEQQLRTTRSKALLISPYFVPGTDATAGLANLAQQGAQVGIVTNSIAANDVVAVHGGYRKYRGTLIDGGVQVHEMRAQGRPGTIGTFDSSGASLHTKAFVVDDARGFIGSFNLDPRSADLNTEMGVLFEDPAIALDLERLQPRAVHALRPKSSRLKAAPAKSIPQ